MKNFRRPRVFPGWAKARWLLSVLFAALVGTLPGCLGPEAEKNRVIRFKNPGLIDSFDSLQIAGINANGGDTVALYSWSLGEAVLEEVPYPPGLQEDFELLVKGYRGGILVYQSRSEVSDGNADSPRHDFTLVAPDLSDLPVRKVARVRDALVLRPVWKARPGVYRQGDGDSISVFTPEAEFAWEKDGVSVGRDSALFFPSLQLRDSGLYRLMAGNAAGRDSLDFFLSIGAMLPKIAVIQDQVGQPGKAFTIKAAVTASDSLLYRWYKADSLVSTDSALGFNPMKPGDTGAYRLVVKNASDTSETAVSNLFRFRAAPEKAWKPEVTLLAGAQGNSSHGTGLDLDIAKAMLFAESKQKQPLMDMLFVFSGGSLKLMSPLAAKKAGDVAYMDDLDESKLVDVKFVKVSSKPANPAAAKSVFDAGTKLSASPAATGNAYIVKTTDANWVYLKINSIQGGQSVSASADLSLAIGEP